MNDQQRRELVEYLKTLLTGPTSGRSPRGSSVDGIVTSLPMASPQSPSREGTGTLEDLGASPLL